ncbi:MAG: hydrolase, partial [Gammaproteobacteria bacterium]|nr:hydrolase [Gammaproteobacteria bacterium]
PADLLLLDWSALDDDSLFPDVDPLDLLLARGTGQHIDQVVIGGRRVVEGGRVLGIDEAAFKAELLAQARSVLANDEDSKDWRETLRALADDLGPFYRSAGFGCC